MSLKKFAVISPLANESDTFNTFVAQLKKVLDDEKEQGEIYFIVDKASKDNTLELCRDLEMKDSRFHAIYAPENRNVVDAYLRGYKEALKFGYDYIIEIDGGLSHDPAAIPQFLRVLSEGHYCVYGSRFINGGSIYNSNWKRYFLSRVGTILSNMLLGTECMT